MNSIIAVESMVRTKLDKGAAYGGEASAAVRRIEQQGKGAWRVIQLDLAELALAGVNGKSFEVTGYGIVFLAKVSHRGALLDLDIGGAWAAFGPGDRLRFPFTNFTVKLNSWSASITPAKAYLLVSLTPESWPEEALLTAWQGQVPIDLLGSSVERPFGGASAYTFVSITEDTDPTLLTYGQQGTFEAHGFKRLQVICDTNSGGANATSFDLVPWYFLGGSAGSLGWSEQGTERIAVPDTDTSGGRYRILTVPVSGRGLMYFAVRNLLAAARTSIGLVVRGIE